MNFSDIKKSIFVYYLSSIKFMFYKVLLDANKNILELFNKKKPDNHLPLWMITGGEGINYYSSPTTKTPTKDIDAKLLFTGKYSITKEEKKKLYDNKLFREFKGKILKKTNILKETGFDYSINEDMKTLNNELKKMNDEFKKFTSEKKTFTAGLETRSLILWNCMNVAKDVGGTGSLLYMKQSENKVVGVESLNMDKLNEHIKSRPNEWINTSLNGKNWEFKMYIIKIPYLQWKDNKMSFPYNTENSGGRGIDKPVSETFLNEIQKKLDYLKNLTQEERLNIWNSYYETMTYMNWNRYLTSLIGVVIIVDKKGNKYIIEEGILDLFIDFTAGFIPGGKIDYENKLSTGAIPNITKKISYCDTYSYIKIPTLNWLIYDQTRMLYHSLMLKEVKHTGWTDEGVSEEGWKDFEDGKQDKYFSKLKGMLKTKLDVINKLEIKYNSSPEEKKEIIETLQKCDSKDTCFPSHFMSFLYDEIYPTELVPETAQMKGACLKIPTGGKKKRKTIKKRK